jgi:hypothetical protein
LIRVAIRVQALKGAGMLRVLNMLTMAAVSIAWAAGPAMAQDAIGKAFSEALFEEQQITESVREHPEVSGLSKEEMNAALQARDALTRRERFGAEIYLSYEIFDFRVNEAMTRVKFRYFLAENDQGKALIRQRAVTFDRAGGAWKISEFDNFDFD